MMKPASNCKAWAIGKQWRNGFHIRCIRWGLLAAQLDKRPGEQIRAAFLQVETKHKPRRDVVRLPPVASPTIERLGQVDFG
jgi:hypothetical protein